MFKYTITATLIVVGFFSNIFAQDSKIITVENSQAYELIHRLQNRGILTSLNPERFPYTEGEIRKAVSRVDADHVSHLEKEWVIELKELLTLDYEYQTDSVYINGYAKGGIALNNSERKEVYRPLGDKIYAYPFAQVNGLFSRRNLVLNANLRHDYYYDVDPDGLDAVNRLYTRNEDSYIGYSNDFLKVYAGRFSNHWGSYGRAAAFISANPRTYDHLNLQLNYGDFTFQSINGFLDNISSDSVFTGGTYFDPNARKRYLSSTRIDWQPTKNLVISYKESILYSASQANFNLKYAMPAGVFVFLADNAPRDETVNLLFGVSIWTQLNRLTLRTEFMYDDIVFYKEDRGFTERDTFSWVFNSTYAFENRPVDLNLNAEVISYQSYNTDQADGRYLYLGRGLATEFNDYVFTDLQLDWYAYKYTPGLRVSPYTGMLFQGEQVIDQPFQREYPDGTPLERVLTGTVERTFRAGINVFYSPVSFFWLKADIGSNSVSNKDNVKGVSEQRVTGMIELGFKLNFGK